ncbi:MAG: methyltransferase [Oscillospiraceae bacterium]|nr:methyltransferase [Oscillospiraceae bacterium]
MEHLHGGFTLDYPDHVFPLSTDSILLADFVRLCAHAKVLDLGSGCGTLGVLLCAKDETCAVTGIELDEKAHLAALENIRRNALDDRMTSICADLRAVNASLDPGAFHCCVSNPPYFSGGPASASTPLARKEDTCTPAELFAAAARALRYGGDFFLVHKTERLAQLCACAAASGLEPKRLRLVRHKEGGSVSLILLSCRKGGKPGLVWEEVSLHHVDGSPTDYYKELYHLK